MMFAPETLHDLTYHQLEAIRGYMTTIAAIDGAHNCVAQPWDSDNPFVREIVRVTIANLDSEAKEPGPYGDGLRFAMRLPSMSAKLAKVHTKLVNAGTEKEPS